jgi:hypothetical protein
VRISRNFCLPQSRELGANDESLSQNPILSADKKVCQVGDTKVCRQRRYGIEGDGCNIPSLSIFFSSFRVLLIISGVSFDFFLHFGEEKAGVSPLLGT